MGNTVQVRSNQFFLRADKAALGLSVPSAFVGGAPTTFAIGVPQTLPVALNLTSERVVSIPHPAGPTSARPTTADFDVPGSLAGLVFLDTSLAKIIVHDGVSWRDPFSGSVV